MLEKLSPSLSDLLRYGFSGGVFLIVLWVISGKSLSDGLQESSGLALVAVVIGSFIYSLHMALVHKLITWILLCNLPCEYQTLACSENCGCFLVKSFERDYHRWTRRCVFPKFQENWDKWVSQIHFLYGCAWATVLGTIFGNIWSVRKENDSWECWCWSAFFVFVALLSFLGAVTQDRDALYYELKIMKKNVSEDIDKLRHRRRWD